MEKRISVCLLLEGTYPYITGGVSAWVHDLIKGIPEVDFILFTISPESNQEPRYELPDNVVGHKDIVITKSYTSGKEPKKKNIILKKLKKIHEVLFTGELPDLSGFFHQMPEEYFLYADAVKSETGWEMITSANQEKNPLYPFSDYYWAWKSAHDMLFTIIGSSLPDADIYHAVSTGFAGMAGITGKFRKNRPFILTEHGLYHKEREMEIRKTKFIRGYQRDMWTKFYTNFSRFCYKYADLVISLFEENRKKQLEMNSPEEKTIVIPNGIDIPRYEVQRKEKEGFHVGLVGRVVPIKDIKTFIATAKITLDSIPEALFYCIGPTDEDEMYYEDCQSLVSSLKISDNFIFTGRQDVREYYSFLDVLLLTSVREAQPLVILEAYIAGVPVVATRVGNIPEMLNFDDRLLASSKDAEKLAGGIQFLHDNPEEREAMITENRKKVHEKYDRLDLHRKYHDIYSQYGDAAWQE